MLQKFKGITKSITKGNTNWKGKIMNKIYQKIEIALLITFLTGLCLGAFFIGLVAYALGWMGVWWFAITTSLTTFLIISGILGTMILMWNTKAKKRTYLKLAIKNHYYSKLPLLEQQQFNKLKEHFQDELVFGNKNYQLQNIEWVKDQIKNLKEDVLKKLINEKFKIKNNHNKDIAIKKILKCLN